MPTLISQRARNWNEAPLAGAAAHKLKVPIRLPLVDTRSSLRAGSPLRSLALRFGRDDRFWEVERGEGWGCQ